MSNVVDITGKPLEAKDPLIGYVLTTDFNKLVEAYNNMLHACQLLEKRVIELENPWWRWW